MSLENQVQLKNLHQELKELRNYMNFKNNGFCQRKLEQIIKNYFGEK